MLEELYNTSTGLCQGRVDLVEQPLRRLFAVVGAVVSGMEAREFLQVLTHQLFIQILEQGTNGVVVRGLGRVVDCRLLANSQALT